LRRNVLVRDLHSPGRLKQSSKESSVSAQLNAPNGAPHASEVRLYGEAAAIHALYQQGLIARSPKPPPPQKPQRGLFERLAQAVRAQLRELSFA
jgi:hypothetical protein